MLKPRITNKRCVYDVASFDPVLTLPADKQINLHSVILTNNYAASGSWVGLAAVTSNFNFYVVNNSNQALATTFNISNGQVYVIQSKQPIDFITFNLVTVPDFTITLTNYNGAGATAALTQHTTQLGGGKGYIAFGAHQTQVAGYTPGITGLDASLYTTYITTGVGTTISSFNNMQVGNIVAAKKIDAEQFMAADLEPYQQLYEQGYSLVPFFQNVDPGNLVELSYRISP